MTRLRLFQVDSFTSSTFKGNPAAVVPLEHWIPDQLMQSIAFENNLSETAFFIPLTPGHYHLRWFTPTTEVKLCGHATLAAAYVIFNYLDSALHSVRFESQLSPLEVTRVGERLALNFPMYQPQPSEIPMGLREALGATPLEFWMARNSAYCLLESEMAVRNVKPSMALLEPIEIQGVVVTAQGETSDFVSRYFAPRIGIPEDPVTGGVHTTLIPLWAEKLGKTILHARQLSARGGELWCELEGDRVSIAGHVAPYLEGYIEVPDLFG